ncbi:hypothetical protein E4U42_003410 [Claviceps africana]|uniref:Uncharacterized protein n=1 Tax=Claviceps africana TaxID=83212 RepID=A0A8K0NGV2_9HYPO|nr:hypothetical protein E4U42_003410 [Claviceps africana]
MLPSSVLLSALALAAPALANGKAVKAKRHDLYRYCLQDPIADWSNTCEKIEKVAYCCHSDSGRGIKPSDPYVRLVLTGEETGDSSGFPFCGPDREGAIYCG